MYFQYYDKHVIGRLKKSHNSCNTDPLAPKFIPHMYCLMVQVWYEFETNQAKATQVIQQRCPNVDGMTESRNDGMTDRLKTVYPPKTSFCGGIIN